MIFTITSENQSIRDHFHPFSVRRNLISSSYLKNQFLETFGSVVYVLEVCGAHFRAFIFIKFVIDITVLVFRCFELRHLTGITLSFTQTYVSTGGGMTCQAGRSTSQICERPGCHTYCTDTIIAGPPPDSLIGNPSNCVPSEQRSKYTRTDVPDKTPINFWPILLKSNTLT